MNHNKLWKILKEMGIPDYQTCLLRNLYAGEEAAELDMEKFSSVQSLSRVRLFSNPWITARQASLSITNSRSSLKLNSTVSLTSQRHPENLPEVTGTSRGNPGILAKTERDLESPSTRLEA